MTMEQIEAGKRTGKGRTRGQGRKDPERHPAVKEPNVIVERIDELVHLHNKAKEAKEDFSEAIAKAAEDSGYLASVVRKLVTARASEKFEERHREVEQQYELFDEVGE
jgi:hypothetical protein